MSDIVLHCVTVVTIISSSSEVYTNRYILCPISSEQFEYGVTTKFSDFHQEGRFR